MHQHPPQAPPGPKSASKSGQHSRVRGRKTRVRGARPMAAESWYADPGLRLPGRTAGSRSGHFRRRDSPHRIGSRLPFRQRATDSPGASAGAHGRGTRAEGGAGRILRPRGPVPGLERNLFQQVRPSLRRTFRHVSRGKLPLERWTPRNPIRRRPPRSPPSKPRRSPPRARPPPSRARATRRRSASAGGREGRRRSCGAPLRPAPPPPPAPRRRSSGGARMLPDLPSPVGR